MGDLAEKVTAQLSSSVPAQPETPVAPDAGNVSCEKQLWDALKTYGFNDYAAAGIMGNIYAESGFRANNLQNTFEKSLGMTDIRSGAGTDNKVVQICPPGAYTIVAEANGKGATKWGKLKSGVGWISLDFVTKL